MKTKNLTLTFLVFFILVLGPVLALPCAFLGTVSIVGEPVNGTLVTAHRNSTGEYIKTAKEAGFGNYTIAVDAAGEYVKFKINGVWADQPEQYCESGNFTYLDLTLNCTDCDNDGYNYTVDCNDGDSEIHPGVSEKCNGKDDNCDGVIDNFTASCYTGPPGTLNVGICKAGSQTCTNGTWSSCTGEVLPRSETCNGLDDDCDRYVDDGVCGGGGEGGGGSTEETTQTNQTGTQQQQCQERWICSEWSECINGVQTRTCRDENNCGTNSNKPFTSQPCSPEERKEEKTSEGVRITGLFALLSNPVYALTFILGIIAVIAIVLSIIFSRRKK